MDSQNDGTENLGALRGSVDLLACPFCGAPPKVSFHFDGQYMDIQCVNIKCAVQPELVDFHKPNVSVSRWNTRSEAWIETKIIEEITAWGQHFSVDTSCVNNDKKHPIWQQIWSLLTSLV